MATFIQLVSNQQRELVETTYKMQKDAESKRKQETVAAIIIQSWYRGMRTRYYLRYLSHCACTIQRTWRGYMGRTFCRIRVKNLVMIMRNNFYNAMAVCIQKHWRGFYARKHTHNYYARKRYLEALAVKNSIVRQELEEYQNQLNMERQKRIQQKTEAKMEFEARKHHYLLSTHQKAGIYNSPFREYPHEMEFRLKVARPLSHQNKDFITENTISTNRAPVTEQGSIVKDEEQIQGPFLPQRRVHMQRLKPLNPSLRVSTNYYSLEQEREKMKGKEWTKRLHEVPFLPFSKTKEVYKPLLHTASKYGHLPYGTKYFTEENKALHIADKQMQTVVSPIPIFDKFGQTYAKGSVVLQ
ncbi:unnamed protein product [Clavelina lepadiformis]|uniref:Spermatogenesis-associated protein 17 n=1 Tax=Clavelina lepadiformis TaxID=159417 RepID=A0ABP0G251_CLALP